MDQGRSASAIPQFQDRRNKESYANVIRCYFIPLTFITYVMGSELPGIAEK